jgi:tripartite ATP-independent transporter DctM subunit
MEPQWIGFIGIGFVVILIILGVPIAVSLGSIGLVGTMLLKGFTVGLDLGSIIPFSSVASYLLTIIPLFLLMGSFALGSGISKDAYDIGSKWLGFMPGGLASATVAGCALFAATSGSSVATSGAMGKIAIEEMKRYGYDPKLACGCVAAGGLLGIMIPPSIILVLYGVITEESIGKLLMAGFIPGFLTAGVFITGITLIAIRHPQLAPRIERASWTERIRSLKGGLGIFILMFSVLGTLYAGLLTPTEAGAFGAFVAFIFFLLRNRNRETFIKAVKESSQITSTIFGIIVGASIFAKFLILAKVPLYTSKFMIGLDVPPLVVLLLIVLVYLLLGMFLDPVSILVLTLPLFYPVVTKLGYNGIWFGIFVTVLIEVGLITPPVGFNVYVIKSIAPEVPLEEVFRGVMPFIIMELVVLGLLVLFPEIALWLPSKVLK